jgi:hypothetical protein
MWEMRSLWHPAITIKGKENRYHHRGQQAIIITRPAAAAIPPRRDIC